MSLDYYLQCPCCKENLFEMNITHNLVEMAKNVVIDKKGNNLYKLLWSYEGKNTIRYREKIDLGYRIILTEADRLIKFEPKNNWGSYEGFLEFVSNIVMALHEFPDAEIRVSV